MPKILPSPLRIPFAGTFALLWSGRPLSAQSELDSANSAFLPKTISDVFTDLNVLPWAIAFSAFSVLLTFAILRLRRKRRQARQKILNLGQGPRFRAVDAMCHACWKGRKLQPSRLNRAVELARDLTDMDYTLSDLTQAARQVDRIILPYNFRWMRDGLSQSEKLVIFNSTLSILLADGPISRSDKFFLRVLARSLGLKDYELRDLAHLIAT